MESANQYSFTIFSSSIITSALLAFALCLAAEFRKSKKNDLILDGSLCYLPETSSFGLGTAALICISLTQFIGTFFVCRNFKVTHHKLPSLILLLISWIIFGIAVILMSVATSMSRSQPFGEGWLNGECYLVKDGIYICSAVLALLASTSTLGSGTMIFKQMRTEEHRKVQAQTDE